MVWGLGFGFGILGLGVWSVMLSVVTNVSVRSLSYFLGNGMHYSSCSVAPHAYGEHLLIGFDPF